MDETEKMSDKDKELISNVTTAIKAIGKRHDGQYFDNILGECSDRFDWDRQGVMTALNTAIHHHIIKEVPVNNKISYRIITTPKKVCIRDNVESISTQTTNDESDVEKRSERVENELKRFVDDFTSFKMFIHSEILLIKANQEKAQLAGLPPPLETPNYEKAFIKSLEARILSLERQLDQKQATIDKLLINSQLQTQVQQLTHKGRENAAEKTETREGTVPNETITKDESHSAKNQISNKENAQKGKDNKVTDKREPAKSSPVGQENINRGVAQGANAKTAESNHGNSEDKGQLKTSTVTKKRKPSVVIVGDSMLNGITEHGLDKQHRIKVKAHPGATSQNILDHIKPAVRRNPDVLIIHAATNDITSDVETVQYFKEIAEYVKTEAPAMKLVISLPMMRDDGGGRKEKIIALNAELKEFCKTEGLESIDNSNLDITCLGVKRLHPNKKGNAFLARNFRTFFEKL